MRFILQRDKITILSEFRACWHLAAYLWNRKNGNVPSATLCCTFGFVFLPFTEELSLCPEAPNWRRWQSCLWEPFNFTLQCSSFVAMPKMSLTSGYWKKQIALSLSFFSTLISRFILKAMGAVPVSSDGLVALLINIPKAVPVAM